MYSAKINFIGCDQQVVPPEAREILNRWAVLDQEFPNVHTVLKNVLMKEGETRLLIVHVASADELSELKRLAATYPKYPILAVVDANNDPNLAVKTMRAGASQVVQSPVEAHDLIEALECIGSKQEGLSALAKVTTVTGTVGGCGATTVAINLANELARVNNTRCVLMELAMRKGMMAHYLDVEPRYTTSSLVADIKRIDSYILQGALTEVAPNFKVLVGPYEAIETEASPLEATMQLVQLSRHLAESLVLDVPSTYDDLFFRTLTDADQVVLVADQTVAAIRGAQMICAGLQKCRPLVVINRYNPKVTSLSVDRIRKVLPNCQLATLINDPTVLDSANNGKPVRAYSNRSPVLADYDKLVQALVPERGAAETTNQSLLNRIGRAFSLS